MTSIAFDEYDDYTPRKKSIVTKFRLAAAFLIGLASITIALIALLLTAVGMVVGGGYTLRETTVFLREALEDTGHQLKDDFQYLIE